jgi:anti-sigma factor RsiW
VRIVDGLDRLPTPGRAEAALLKSIEAAPDIRLACQLRPTAPVTVRVLFRPERLEPIPVDFVEVKEVAAAHQRAVLTGETFDVPAANAPALQTWLTGRAAVRIALEDLAADGFEIKGARLDYLRNRPTVAIAYEKKGEAVTLFMMPTSDATSVALSGQRNGHHVLGWSDDRYAYFAVSKLEFDQLERLEQSFTERARDEEIRTALLTTKLNKEAQR